MTIDKMREDFEAWMALRDGDDEIYGEMFAAWKASRESLVIELPIPKEVCGPDGSYMEYFEPEQIERTIEAAGLKVAK